MSITSAKTGATGISLALENNFMEPIASVLVGAGTASEIVFDEIPQNYKHLQIRAIGQVTLSSDPGGSGGCGVNFNKDFGVNYTRHELGGPGGGTVAPYGLADVSGGTLQRFPFRQTNDNIYGVTIGDILDYSNSTKFKTLKNIGGFDKNSASGVTGDVYMNSFLWRSTAPISTISLTTGVWNWKQHSRISLYGIKG